MLYCDFDTLLQPLNRGSSTRIASQPIPKIVKPICRDVSALSYREKVQMAEECCTWLVTTAKSYAVALTLASCWREFHGMIGVESGLRLVAELLYRYPTSADDIEEYVSAHFSPLESLLSFVREEVRRVPLTAAPRKGEGYSLMELETARRLWSLAQTDNVTRAIVTSERRYGQNDVIQALRITMPEEVEKIRLAVGRIKEVLQSHRVFDPLMMTTAERRAMDDLFAVLEYIGESRWRDVLVCEPEQEVVGDVCLSTDDTINIDSRDHAYELLKEAADYLMRAEPFSPTPHLLQRAVAWGNMTLDQVLAEFIGGDADVRQMALFLGIKSGSAA